jgi:hypothetical protein
MSDIHQICLVEDQICMSSESGLLAMKNRSGTKTMNLGPDKLTTSKQDTIEHIEINRATRCNLFTRNHT